MGLAGIAAAVTEPCTVDRATGTTIDPQPFLEGAYGSQWSAAAGRVAFMRRDGSGYYRVFTIRPDGSDDQALAARTAQVPTKHQGMPFWHPSGRYLLFVAQKMQWSGPSLFGNPDYEALPGFGRHDDLWLITQDGASAWQLTQEPNTTDQGVLVPVFSADGRRIAWSSRLSGGTYQLTIADFVEAPQPHLENLRSFQPGGAAYYETGSFSSDGASLLYTSDQDTHSFWRSQIYRLDLATGRAARLTRGSDYNEHPRIIATPTGDWVVYMSTKGVDRFPFRLLLGTDWYAMRPDGSGAKRLTRMNLNRRTNPQNTGAPLVATTVTPGPSGVEWLGDVQDKLTRQTGSIRRIRLTCDPPAAPSAPPQVQ
jgi:Tol biopolymer transport system component